MKCENITFLIVTFVAALCFGILFIPGLLCSPILIDDGKCSTDIWFGGFMTGFSVAPVIVCGYSICFLVAPSFRKKRHHRRHRSRQETKEEPKEQQKEVEETGQNDLDQLPISP